MWDASGLIQLLTQHQQLNIILHSHNNHHALPQPVYDKLLQPHRMRNYFFIFVDKGATRHMVDMQETVVQESQLLFLLPHQIHVPPASKKANEYYKLSLDDDCLKLLPKWYPFLINPFNNQVVRFSKPARERIRQSFVALEALLMNSKNSNTQLLLAWLHIIMTEINEAYFSSALKNENNNLSLSRFILFKQIIEKELTAQPSITAIAKQLSVSSNALYTLVKEYAGVSPKEYFTNRIMLEAQRVLFYSTISTKELAFDLGFSDPDYFSRLFKKHTGKSITRFLEEVQDLSGKIIHP